MLLARDAAGWRAAVEQERRRGGRYRIVVVSGRNAAFICALFATK